MVLMILRFATMKKNDIQIGWGSCCSVRLVSIVNWNGLSLTSKTGQVYRKPDATEELYGSLNNINSVTTQ
jgi:hypothetical protein